VNQLSPLRPVLSNGDPLIEFLRNALTFERVLQRPAPSPKSSVDNQSVTVMHGGHQGRERIPRNFGPPTDDEPFRYEFAAPLGT